MSMSNILTQHLLSFKNGEGNVKDKPNKNSWGNEYLGIVIYLKPHVSKQYKHISYTAVLEFIIINAVSACHLYSSMFLESLEQLVVLLLMYISQSGVTPYMKHFWAWSSKGKIL